LMGDKHTFSVVDDETDKRRLRVVTWQRTGDDVRDAAEKTVWQRFHRSHATGTSCRAVGMRRELGACARRIVNWRTRKATVEVNMWSIHCAAFII